MEKFRRCREHPAYDTIAKEFSKEDAKNFRIYENDIYEVWVYKKQMANFLVHEESDKDKLTYLSIKRKDKQSIHDWRHFQEIKNELVGEEREAVEIYPKESRLHDTVNQYHLFVVPAGRMVPFGWTNRNVDYTAKVGGHNVSGQRGKENKSLEFLAKETFKHIFRN